MDVDPIGALACYVVWVKGKFALFVGAGFSLVTAAVGGRDPAFAERRVDHGAPLAFIPNLTHGGVGILQYRKNACCIGDPFFPTFGFAGCKMTRQPFNQGVLFHGPRNACRCAPFQ